MIRAAMDSPESDLYSPSLDERYDVCRMKSPMSPWPLLYGVLLGGFFIAGMGFGENFRRLGHRRAGLITMASGVALTALLFSLGYSDLVRFARSTDRRNAPTASESHSADAVKPDAPKRDETPGATLFFLCNLVAVFAAWPIARYQRRFVSTWERSGRALGSSVAWIVIANLAYLCLWIGALREFGTP